MSVPSLAELRLAIGRKGIPLRQQELADLAKISQAYLSQIEAGQRRPSVYMVLKLAAAFEMTPAKLNESVSETLRRHKLGKEQIRLPS